MNPPKTDKKLFNVLQRTSLHQTCLTYKETWFVCKFIDALQRICGILAAFIATECHGIKPYLAILANAELIAPQFKTAILNFFYGRNESGIELKELPDYAGLIVNGLATRAPHSPVLGKPRIGFWPIEKRCKALSANKLSIFMKHVLSLRQNWFDFTLFGRCL